MTTITLAGAALKAEATRLAIPGRSKMSADQLREAVTTTLATLAATDPTAGTESAPDSLDDWAAQSATRALSERGGTPLPQQRPQVASDPLPALETLPAGDWRREVRAILATEAAPMSPAVFATRWGKRKPSTNGRTHRRTR